jgi:2,4-dienoyl-CoA reductase-like NADH-dependent reductase (Old Yellow Enzyme family)
MSQLFSPIKIKNITLKNRIVMSPMCQYSAVDGVVNDWHLTHYVSRAVGGVGLIIQEATAVSPEGRISYADLGIWNDKQVEAMYKLNQKIKKYGCVPGIQIAHSGRKASAEVAWNGGRQLHQGLNSWDTIAPSAVPFHEKDKLPIAMDVEMIQNVIQQFQDAASRALNAGYEVLEIHAAHGYLIHEFYSPLSNFRSDEYGGCFENRIRFLLEIVQSVHKVWPSHLPLFVRISATDWIEGGWTIEDSVRLARILKSMQVDLIDVSTGANTPKAPIAIAANYQVPFSEIIKRESNILTGAVGLIDNAQQAESILQNEQADLIFIGRKLLKDPYFALHAAQELDETILWPSQYLRGI